MLKRYLTLQQQRLNDLGKERLRLREQADKEAQRVRSLQELQERLQRRPERYHSLLLQNQLGMGQQVQHLVESQQQQSALAQLDLAHHETQLRREFGRVKGLQQVVARRDTEAQHKAESLAQRQLDELATRRFLLNSKG